MKIKIRKSTTKSRRMGGFLRRRRTKAGRNLIARRRRGHK
ncbi:MAG: 50S ribosomal protein L34 [Candidatus Brocadiaceae bacterium]|nr:50S ribosomal protein L34 [Candidatus Brocadiaceae bacterium]